MSGKGKPLAERKSQAGDRGEGGQMIKEANKASFRLRDPEGNIWIVNLKYLEGDSDECPLSRYIEILFYDKAGIGFSQIIHIAHCDWCNNYGLCFMVDKRPICFECASSYLAHIEPEK